MFRRTCLLGLLLIVALFIGKLIYVTFCNMELAEFKPVVTIFLLDTSASNKNLQAEQEKTILRIAKRLDSEDHTLVYIVSEDTYNIYNGNPHKLPEIRKSMQKRGTYDEKSYGTAYGLALKKAVNDALKYKEQGYRPAIIVLGDLENEGDIKKQINWNTLPENIKKTREFIPDLTLAFLYAHPQKLDSVRQTLLPVMEEKNLVIASEENIDLAIRKLMEALSR